MHRQWRDADVYFFFNENDQAQSITATMQGAGTTQLWDTRAARVQNLSEAQAQNGTIKLPIQLEKYGARLIVIGAPAVVAAR
jgi:hypothetical protein